MPVGSRRSTPSSTPTSCAGSTLRCAGTPPDRSGADGRLAGSGPRGPGVALQEGELRSDGFLVLVLERGVVVSGQVDDRAGRRPPAGPHRRLGERGLVL